MNQWFGLLKWSLNYHDGTKAPTDFKPMSEEDKKWLAAAMKSHTVDVVERYVVPTPSPIICSRFDAIRCMQPL